MTVIFSAADVLTIQKLVERYGKSALLSAVSKIEPAKSKVGRPCDPAHNCAAAWAFVEFIKNHRVTQKKKKLDVALDWAEATLKNVTPRENPFTRDALRNLYYEAKKRAKTEAAIADLMTLTYKCFEEADVPMDAVPIPILARNENGEWVFPAIDRHQLANPDALGIQIISL